MSDNRPPVNKIAILIAVTLIILGYLIQFTNQHPTTANPMALYQSGMMDVISGVFGLAGWITLIAAFIIRPVPKLLNCPECGTAISNSDDIYCRKCGSRIKMK
jgi:hypothetical protein